MTDDVTKDSNGNVLADGDSVMLRWMHQELRLDADEVRRFGGAPALHGLTDDRLAGGVPLEDAVARLLAALAGLPPAGLPGWLAALLSSLGVWLNTPLQWLTWWLVYGVAVLLVMGRRGDLTCLPQRSGQRPPQPGQRTRRGFTSLSLMRTSSAQSSCPRRWHRASGGLRPCASCAPKTSGDCR